LNARKAFAKLSKLVWEAKREFSEIGIVLPNNQRQHRTLHIQKDVLLYALSASSRR